LEISAIELQISKVIQMSLNNSRYLKLILDICNYQLHSSLNHQRIHMTSRNRALAIFTSVF